jgi:hypothetical protein
MFLFLFVLGAVLGSGQNAAAQDNLIAMIQSDVRAEAQRIMTYGMQLSNADATNFWPIYREYELERSKWGDLRIALIRRFAAQYETMTDEVAEDLAEEMFDLLDDRIDLYKSFFGKFSDAVSASVGARFVQVERQLNMIMDLQIAGEMPLIFAAPPR